MMSAKYILGVSVALATVSAASTQDHYAEFPLRKTAKVDGDLVKVSKFTGNFANASLQNFQYYYQIRLDIGTPPQPIDFTIDTGSSDLWVMAKSNPYCTLDSNNATGINCTGSVFDYDTSGTFLDLNQPFEIAYGDGTFANGSLVNDVVRLGAGTTNLLNATFGLAREGNSSTCVFGIGFVGDEGEAHVHKNKTGVYPTYFNIPTLMKQQGYIDTNAYALWLNDAKASEGSVLFGGVDSSKFVGPLTVMPIYNNYYEYIEHPIQTRVMLNAVEADSKPLADFNIAVLLDSGTSFSYLPQDLLDAFGKSLGFIYDESIGYYFGSTSSALENVKEFKLNFSGAKISVPTSDLLVALTKDDGTPFKIDGKALSILAMSGTDDSYSYILGDVFLRSMYAVFDLDHYEIALAQSHKNSTETPNISLIEASIPGALQAPGYASTSTNNSVFNIHPFTPAVPAPTAITINFTTADTTSTQNASTTLIPSLSSYTSSPRAHSTPVVTTTATVLATTTTTEKETFTTTLSTAYTETVYSTFETDDGWNESWDSLGTDKSTTPDVTLYWDDINSN